MEIGKIENGKSGLRLVVERFVIVVPTADSIWESIQTQTADSQVPTFYVLLYLYGHGWVNGGYMSCDVPATPHVARTVGASVRPEVQVLSDHVVLGLVMTGFLVATQPAPVERRPDRRYCWCFLHWSGRWTGWLGGGVVSENINKHRFMRMFKDLRQRDYGERLKSLNLWTLEDRRNRQDLIEGLGSVSMSYLKEM